MAFTSDQVLAGLKRELDDWVRDRNRRFEGEDPSEIPDELPSPAANERWADQAEIARESVKIAAWALGVSGRAGEVRRAYERLVGWVPECGFPFDETMDGDDPKRIEDEEIPFLTESYTYSLLGKEDARTLLALVSTLAEAAGIPRLEQHRIAIEVHRFQEEELAQRRAAARARDERRAARKEKT